MPSSRSVQTGEQQRADLYVSLQPSHGFRAIFSDPLSPPSGSLDSWNRAGQLAIRVAALQWLLALYSRRERSEGRQNLCSLLLVSHPLLVSHAFALNFVLFCFDKLFWTQACPEGMGTNGTHRSHARCHPYPIQQPVKVGHTTGVYVPYSFRKVVWVLLRPTRTDQ